MNELQLLKERVQTLEGILSAIILSDRFLFSKTVQMTDGRNITLGGTNGTKIGTSAAQKIAFFGHSPVTQQSGTGQLAKARGTGGTLAEDATFDGGLGGTAYYIGDVVKALKNYGLLAA